MAIYFNRNRHFQAICHYRNVNRLQQHKTYHWIDISLLCLLVYKDCSIKNSCLKDKSM
jgi:hypothetical protein